MMKLVLALAVAGTLLVTYATGTNLIDLVKSVQENQQTTTELTNVNALELPKTSEITANTPKVTLQTVQKTLTLETKNTVVFRGPVMALTVAKATRELLEMSRELAKTDTIYLVLDTPGGSVSDGSDFIDFLAGLPQKVTTVTMFAASMGFQIVENNSGERLITRSGLLMSHRAFLGGLGGQLNGEFESRYKMIKRQIDYLEAVDAKRVGLTIEQYQAKIVNEWWVHGYDAAEEKVADGMVMLQCGKSLVGQDVITVDTMFGPVEVVFDKCPLFRDPVEIRMSKIANENKAEVTQSLNDLFYNKVKFVKDYILTGKYYQIFQ